MSGDGSAERSGLAPGAATLAAAVQAVSAVAHEGRSADVALLAAEPRADRAAVRAIALGTLRWYLRLAPAVAQVVARNAEDLVPLLRALLVTAAHQVEHSRGAPEVSVHLAVDAARALGLGRAAGLVNAAMRRFVRERETLFAALDADLAVRTAHPSWLVDHLQQAWGDRTVALLEALDEHPPMVLRVAGDRDAYLAALAAEGRAATASPWAPDAVILERSVAVATLPGFTAGAVSVQDAGAQLAARLLAAGPGQRVLDACAAPGGKTAHILQSAAPPIDLLAIDIEPQRLALVAGTLQRIGLAARLRAVDLAAFGVLDAEAPFDRILLDAPCSATGVIRRHPDIKLLRRPEDIAAFARLQGVLLDRCFAKLAPAGRMVYATCSVLPQENEVVVQAFLDRTPAARSADWPADVEPPPGSVRGACGVQLLPGAGAGTDGFYYACLGRREHA